MRNWDPVKPMARNAVMGTVLLGVVLLLARSIHSAPIPLLAKFFQVNEHGFGDRQNTWAWSMRWWRGKLYIGTNRSWLCVQNASLHLFLKVIPYPPLDPDVECTSSPQDLPLQAEIWRYAPEVQTWERVYQSPNGVPIPGAPGKYVAHDIGFRTMTVFPEADRTEALYVGGVNSQAVNPGVPPPRILRSTDGHRFVPVPQDPGTVLGDLGQASFRSFEVYNGRLYVVAGNIQGGGFLLEATDPKGGNDNFREVTPGGMVVNTVKSFNGFLYLGLFNLSHGYAVVKTDACGPGPYTFTSIVSKGGFRTPRASKTVLSMHVFQGRLYVGTDKPTELIRINPDDTWDLVVGSPRYTPDGWKYPLSGLFRGFNNWYNGHIWQMQDHDGWLYVGTMDWSTTVRGIPVLGRLLRPLMGFDLFATDDGVHFTALTRTGFGDPFEFGVRSFASTPYGLFLGTANNYYGTGIYQALTPARSPHAPEYRADLPSERCASST